MSCEVPGTRNLPNGLAFIYSLGNPNEKLITGMSYDPEAVRWGKYEPWSGG